MSLRKILKELSGVSNRHRERLIKSVREEERKNVINIISSNSVSRTPTPSKYWEKLLGEKYGSW